MTASDPPPNGGSGEASSLAAEAQEIYRQRQQLEERMEALAGFLTSEDQTCAAGMPGLDGPLVDEEGFPRADIDVHAVRDARHQLACLKTDYRELQRRLEDILFRIHEDSARKAPDDQSNAAPTTHDETNETSETPTRQEDQPPPLLDDEGPAFAMVDVVYPGSPSSTAGIVAGDRLLRLGMLRLAPTRSRSESRQGGACNGVSAHGNTQTPPLTVAEIFQQLPGEVSSHENERVAVVVQRGSRILSLWLVPRRWEGRGLLGCHLKPI